MSDADFFRWCDFKRPNANLSPHRFAIELPERQIINNCSWDQIMAICDQFKADNPSGHLTFDYKGFQCIIKFSNNTQFNGYIMMPKPQRDWLGQNRQALEQYEPHGGITCESALDGPGFGFDCAHGGDQQINPFNRNGPMMENPDGRQITFKTPEFVEAELRAWADHLASVLRAAQIPAEHLPMWDEPAEPADQA
jgi:hypothetical protein